jgi:hypothetical protein
MAVYRWRVYRVGSEAPRGGRARRDFYLEAEGESHATPRGRERV